MIELKFESKDERVEIPDLHWNNLIAVSSNNHNINYSLWMANNIVGDIKISSSSYGTMYFTDNDLDSGNVKACISVIRGEKLPSILSEVSINTHRCARMYFRIDENIPDEPIMLTLYVIPKRLIDV